MSRKKKNSRKRKPTGAASKAATFAAVAQALYWLVKIIKELRD